MAKEKSLAYNMLLNGVLKVSSYIFPVIAYPYASRILNPEGMGRVSFATSVLTYFMILAQLGIPTYGVQACAKVRDDKEKLSRTVHELFFVNIIMTFFSYIVFAVLLFHVPQLNNDKILFLSMSIMILLKSTSIEWLYQAIEQYSYITSRALVVKIISIPFLFILVRAKSDYIYYGVLTVIASYASSIFNLLHAHKYIYVKPLGCYHIKRHIKHVFVLFAVSCATMVYTNLDTFMLGMIKDSTETGYYNAAVNIKLLLTSFVNAVVMVLLPRMSYYLEKEMEQEFKETFKKAVHAMLWLVFPVVIYFIFFAEESIHLVSGPAFTNAVVPMQIIMPTVLFIGMTNIIGLQILVAMEKGKITLYSVLAGATVDLILNIILIPRYGASGASIGTLVAEIVVFLVQYIYICGITGNPFLNFNWKRLIISGFLGSVSALWVKFLNILPIFSLLLSASLFFGCYVVILLLKKEPLILEMLCQIKGIFKYNKISQKNYSKSSTEMRKDMNRKSYYFRKIFDDYISHLKIIVLFIVICVLVLGVIGYRQANQIKYLSDEEQEKVDIYNEQLDAYDKQIEEAQGNIDIIEEEIEKLQKYIDEADYMKLDPMNIYVSVAQYAIADTADPGGVMYGLTNFFAYGNAQQCLEAEYGSDKSGYLRELFSWATNGNILNITVLHYEQEEGKKILKILQKGLEEHVPEVINIYGQFSLKPMESTFYTKTDNDLTNAQNGKMDTLKNYNISLADYQSRVASNKSAKETYIEDNTPDVLESAAPGNKTLIIYIIFGVLFGCIVPFAVLILRYIVSDRIRSAKELVNMDIPVFSCNSQKEEDLNQTLEVAELGLMVKKCGADGFFLNLLSEDETVKDMSNKIISAFKEKEIVVSAGVMAGENVAELEKMIEKQYAVMVLKANENTYPQLSKQMGACQKFGVPVWGCIVIE